MNPNLPPYALRLRRLRERRGLKRRAVSELCGLSQNMVKRYEEGTVEPGATALTALAEFYGVSTDYLLGRPPKKYF